MALLSQEKLTRLKEDPVYFVELCSPYVPYDYQRSYLRDESPRIIVKKGRQIGASQMVAWSATWYAYTMPETTVLIISPSQRQSGIIFRKIRSFIKNSRILRGSVERETWSEVELSNGSLIVSLPSGEQGDTIRGYTADLLIADEAAFMKDPVFNAIEDSTIRGGKRVYISTPFGVKNRFYNIWHNPDWSKLHVPSTMCPDISPEEIERKEREKSYTEFQQEVMGEFVESASLFFEPERIKDCIIPQHVANIAAKVEGVFTVLSCDPARHGTDFGVIMEAIAVGDNVMIKRCWAWYDKPLTHYIGTIKQLNEKNNYDKIVIDETGLGGGLVDVLKENSDIRRVEGVTMTLKNKTVLYTNARSLIEEKQVFIPANLRYTGDIVNQLANIEFENTQSGAVKIKSKDDDFADAFVLAVWGIKRRRGTTHYRGS